MREIVFDTETTGIDPNQGHKIVEIGFVELINLRRTGRELHHYINPERDIPYIVTKIHGIRDQDVANKPIFKDVADEILEFIGDDILIAHNAGFDRKFLNHELSQIGRDKVCHSRFIDTLEMARKKYPGSPASLDALCGRFKIDLSERSTHGALLDSQLLAGVYLEFHGGAQKKMDFSSEDENDFEEEKAQRKFIEPRKFPASPEEIKRHEEFLGGFVSEG